MEIKIISAASDGHVVVTPEKCERIRELLREYVRNVISHYDIHHGALAKARELDDAANPECDILRD